jgi:crotonobetainyl-CoA:carnitine CoA-transferase CaiB-like acyl-CoA transferase
MSAMPRVLEFGSSVAGGYCGRLLAMMGAQVIRVETQISSPVTNGAGPETVSALDEYLGCYKSSLALDPDRAAGAHALERLYGQSDIVVEPHEGDPEPVFSRYEKLRNLNPGLIYVVLSPFGLTGPYSSYLGNEFIDLAASGHLSITGDPDREPLQAGGPWSSYAAGTMAAIGALAAVHRVQQTGEGRLLDIGRMEAMASIHQWSLIIYTHQGYVMRRWGNRMAEFLYPYSFFRCSDGWVCIGVASPIQWEGFCLAIDRPEFLLDKRYKTGGDRFDHADEMDTVICPILEKLSVAEVVARMQAHRVPTGPILGAVETLLDEQLNERGFWAPLSHLGPEARVPERSFHLEGEAAFRRAPRSGEQSVQILRQVGLSEAEIDEALADLRVGQPGGHHVS